MRIRVNEVMKWQGNCSLEIMLRGKEIVCMETNKHSENNEYYIVETRKCCSKKKYEFRKMKYYCEGTK